MRFLHKNLRKKESIDKDYEDFAEFFCLKHSTGLPFRKHSNDLLLRKLRKRARQYRKTGDGRKRLCR